MHDTVVAENGATGWRLKVLLKRSKAEVEVQAEASVPIK